jgi:heme A synthase
VSRVRDSPRNYGLGTLPCCRVTRFARFAWGLLTYDLCVVAWGAYVRATGSGAGCGRHWPLCNGEVIPRAPRTETLIELSHRISSGVAFGLTLFLVAWSICTFPRGHIVRRGAAAAAALVVVEALIGAGLVLFELVAHDASAKRAMSVALHLVNTFFLLGATAMTAWWASGGSAVRVRGQGIVAWTAGLSLAAMLVVGITGAVTALGDTLFPVESIASGFAQDFSGGAHWFVRLRALHPLLAVLTACMIVASARILRTVRPSPSVNMLTRIAAALAIAQVAAGMLDVITLAPVLVQLAHLVLADVLWLCLLLAAAAAMAQVSAQAGPPSHPRRPPRQGRQELRAGSGEAEGVA